MPTFGRAEAIETWSVPDAARMIGVPYRTLRRWLMDGQVRMTFHPRAQRQERLRLTCEDIAEAWCIWSLRKAGVSLQAIRRIMVRLESLQEREQKKLTDFRSVLVEENGAVIGVHYAGTQERLTDGQVRIDLRRLREQLTETPGEPVPVGWMRVLELQEAGYFV
jgi:DNA-binding transcriptional MerR regulator